VSHHHPPCALSFSCSPHWFQPTKKRAAFRSRWTHDTFDQWAVIRELQNLVKMAKRHWVKSSAKRACAAAAAGIAGTGSKKGKWQVLGPSKTATEAASSDDLVGYGEEPLGRSNSPAAMSTLLDIINDLKERTAANQQHYDFQHTSVFNPRRYKAQRDIARMADKGLFRLNWSAEALRSSRSFEAPSPTGRQSGLTGVPR
jgi:hypothetical protein